MNRMMLCRILAALVFVTSFSSLYAASKKGLPPACPRHTESTAVRAETLAISAVTLLDVTDTTATVAWMTNSAADSSVHWGTATPPTHTTSDAASTRQHAVTITGLAACTTYRFSVSSGSVTDNNGGNYFTFDTETGPAMVLFYDPVNPSSRVATPPSPPGPLDWQEDICRTAPGSTTGYAWKVGAHDAPTCTAKYDDLISDSQLLYANGDSSFFLGDAGHGFHLRYGGWRDMAPLSLGSLNYCRVQVLYPGENWRDAVAPFSGSTSAWVARDINLAPFAGDAQFRFLTSGSIPGTYEGWYVGDVRLERFTPCVPFRAAGTALTDTCGLTPPGWGSGDGVIDPGENISFYLTLANDGASTATDVSVSLASLTTGVTIASGSSSFPSISPLGSVSSTSAFSFVPGLSMSCGTTLNFQATVSSSLGGPYVLPLSFTLGQVDTTAVTVFSADFEAVTAPALPSGWNQLLWGTELSGWQTSETLPTEWGEGPDLPDGMSGKVALLDFSTDDTVSQDDALITPTFNCASAKSVFLSFDTYFRAIDSDSAIVEVSRDGGLTWQLAARWTSDLGNASEADHEVLDVTAQAAGSPAVRVRFRYLGCYGFYWLLDNVAVEVENPTGSCTMTPCSAAASAPGEACSSGTMRAEKEDEGEVSIEYAPACRATDHALYWGHSPIVDSVNWTGSACGFGTGGEADFNPGTPSVGTFYYFVVVGQTSSREGSYGRDGNGAERPASASGTCRKTQDLTDPCS